MLPSLEPSIIRAAALSMYCTNACAKDSTDDTFPKWWRCPRLMTLKASARWGRGSQAQPGILKASRVRFPRGRCPSRTAGLGQRLWASIRTAHWMLSRWGLTFVLNISKEFCSNFFVWTWRACTSLTTQSLSRRYAPKTAHSPAASGGWANRLGTWLMAHSWVCHTGTTFHLKYWEAEWNIQWDIWV